MIACAALQAAGPAPGTAIAYAVYAPSGECYRR